MPLYVIRPDDPPAGEDWVTSVPGQYLYNVTSVYATLTTGGDGTTALDASGHGFDGTYAMLVGTPTFVPGLVPGDQAWVANDSPTAPTTAGQVDIPQGFMDWTSPWALAWVQLLGIEWVGQTTDYFISESITPEIPVQIHGTGSGNTGASPCLIVSGFLGTAWTLENAQLPADGAEHFVMISWDGADLWVGIDGVVVPWDTIGTPGDPGEVAVTTSIGFNGAGAGIQDEVAFFAHEIPQSYAATLYDARGDINTYTGAVLSLGPIGYYHLDGTGGTGRQVTLSITDSNTEVERICSGLNPFAGPGPYQWSWLPKLQAASLSNDASTITVPLSSLLLPAGYTIGTKTPDLTPTDQWSNISVWWNSDVMDASQNVNPYEYPPGATLVYRQIQGNQ